MYQLSDGLLYETVARKKRDIRNILLLETNDKYISHTYICIAQLIQEVANTMFPLHRIGFYNVVKTIRYIENRIRYITLYNITCFH